MLTSASGPATVVVPPKLRTRACVRVCVSCCCSKQLQDGRIFAPVSSAPPYIYLMPGALRSSGEDSGGWLESAFTRQAAREAQVQQQELQLLKGWKSSGHTEAAPPSFRMVRGLSAEMQDRILSYFDGGQWKRLLFF